MSFSGQDVQLLNSYNQWQSAIVIEFDVNKKTYYIEQPKNMRVARCRFDFIRDAFDEGGYRRKDEF
jgi:hypothetical protein